MEETKIVFLVRAKDLIRERASCLEDKRTARFLFYVKAAYAVFDTFCLNCLTWHKSFTYWPTLSYTIFFFFTIYYLPKYVEGFSSCVLFLKADYTRVSLRPPHFDFLRRENTLARWRHLWCGPGTAFHQAKKGFALFARLNVGTIYKKWSFIPLSKVFEQTTNIL